MISDNLNTNEYNPYYKAYIDAASHVDIITSLKDSLEHAVSFYVGIPQEKHNYAYGNGKWTIKEVLHHVIDTERIFSYRALRIGRNDSTPIPGYEQDDYVINANIQDRSFEDLIEEYKAVRISTIMLFKGFNEQNLKQIGKASGLPISVRAIGYIISGHENHHNKVLKERYL